MLSAAALAQSGAQNGSSVPGWTQDEMAQFERRLLFWEMQAYRSDFDRQMADRRAAEYRRREFEGKINRFIVVWNKLMGDYSQRGAFNVKDARALSKAFHEMEGTGWPK
jgi:hypothetical protein